MLYWLVLLFARNFQINIFSYLSQQETIFFYKSLGLQLCLVAVMLPIVGFCCWNSMGTSSLFTTLYGRSVTPLHYAPLQTCSLMLGHNVEFKCSVLQAGPETEGTFAACGLTPVRDHSAQVSPTSPNSMRPSIISPQMMNESVSVQRNIKFSN